MIHNLKIIVLQDLKIDLAGEKWVLLKWSQIYLEHGNRCIKVKQKETFPLEYRLRADHYNFY